MHFSVTCSKNEEIRRNLVFSLFPNNRDFVCEDSGFLAFVDFVQFSFLCLMKIECRQFSQEPEIISYPEMHSCCPGHSLGPRGL